MAALCGALSAALSAMVANLTVGKKGYEASQKTLKRTALRGQELKDEYLRLVDLDTEAFNKVMEALRLPKVTDEQAAERRAALEAATKEATLVPFRTLEGALELLKLARKAAEKGNRNSLSDAGVAALAARAAAEGAYYNVRINLPGLSDEEFKTRTARAALSLRRRVLRGAGEIGRLIEKGLRKL